MQLINKSTSQPLVEFKGANTIIHSRFLEHEMRSIGIPVPHGLRGVYHGKECVRLEDDDFQSAFKEIYYPTVMNPKLFEWRE